MQYGPDRFEIGPHDSRTTYELAESHFLVKVRPGQDVQAATEAFSEAGVAVQPAPYIEAAGLTLRPGGFAWVESEASFSNVDAADALRQRDEVEEVYPVYFAEGRGPESATSPMVRSILVQVADGSTVESVVDALGDLGLAHNAAASTHLAPFHLFEVGHEVSVTDAIDLLPQVQDVAGVAHAEFDWLKLQTYTATPNDTFYANQWNMSVIQLDDARDLGTGAATVWIGVIDSGFDLAHPDIDFTPNAGTTLTHFDADTAIAGNPPPYNAGTAGVFHGTAVAGIAGALTDNSTGVAGVGGGCRVMPIRLGTVPSATRVTAGVNWAANNGAAVATMSLSTTNIAAAAAAMTNAWAAGLVVLAATGNSGDNTTSPAVNFPANHANVIAVGASDQNDQRKRPASADGEGWGSQFDANTDVLAPGVQIWTTDEQGATGYNVNGGAVTVAGVNYPSAGDGAGDYFSVFNGTSAATPHVAGLAALILSVNPALTNQQVRDIIESTCDKVSPTLYAYANTPGRANGTWHQEPGYGRINARSALCAAIRSIETTTSSIVFNSVPQGDPALRAATFAVTSCTDITLQIAAGPSVTSGPGSFVPFLGATSVTVPASTTGTTGQLWFAFTGQAPGTSTNGQVTIECPETGDSWTISISANSIPPVSTAVAMVLDQSGSMNADAGDGRDRIDVLKDSAPVLPGMLDADDAIGVVAFDSDAFLRQAVTDVAAGGAIGAGGAIAAHTPNAFGRTSIGDGLAMARTELDDPSVTQTSKAIVVLTDGRENEPQTIAAAAAAINDRVFAIGLGAPEHIDPGALTAVTNGTGGYALITGTLDSDDFFTLQKYYLQILAGVTNADVVLDPDGFVRPGDAHTIPFDLTDGDHSADVIVLTPAPDSIRPTVVTPGGDKIDQSNIVTVGGRHVVGQGFAAFRMPLPVAAGGGAHGGRWHLVLEVDDAGFKRYFNRLEREQNGHELELAQAHGLRYSANVHVKSSVNLAVTTTQKDPRPGSGAKLRATLDQAGLPLTDVKVRVEVTTPDRKTEVLGTELRSGRWCLELPTDIVGVYRCRVLASGRSLSGAPFTREQLATVACWDPDRLAPDLDPPREDDGDGGHEEKCDLAIRVLVGLLAQRTRCTEGLATEMRRRGHDYGRTLECLIALIGRRSSPGRGDIDLGRLGRRIDIDDILADRRTMTELVPEVLRTLASRLDANA